jgi:hypothetical protein
MGASDFMVGNAPQGASYSAPLVGFAFGKALADLPDSFMAGREQARTRAMQAPILDPNTGEPSQAALVLDDVLLSLRHGVLLSGGNDRRPGAVPAGLAAGNWAR